MAWLLKDKRDVLTTVNPRSLFSDQSLRYPLGQPDRAETTKSELDILRFICN
jgi:hypothetical protein